MTDPNKTSRPVVNSIKTQIWSEPDGTKPSDHNNNLTLCHGYDYYNDLLGRYSWIDIVFLLLKGDLPSTQEYSVLNLVMCSIINPGPRDWATQAAMTAGITGSSIGNSLLSGLAVLQGRFHGALCLEKSIEMFNSAKHIASSHENAETILSVLCETFPDLPGYGLHYSQKDHRPLKLIELIRQEPFETPHLGLALELEKIISEQKGIYLTLIGAVAAVLSDLGFSPQQGHGLFLISAAPGILAHLLEQKKGWSSYPFYDPPQYDGPRNNQLNENEKIYGD